jgi:hypothetical protein
MQFLTKAFRSSFQTKEQYEALRAQWAKSVNDPAVRQQLTATHHLLYLALMGKDWRRAFSLPGAGRSLSPRPAYWETVNANRWRLSLPVLTSEDIAQELKARAADHANRSVRQFENGRFVGWVAWKALARLRWLANPNTRAVHVAAFLAPFAGTVSLDMLRSIAAYLPREDRERLGKRWRALRQEERDNLQDGGSALVWLLPDAYVPLTIPKVEKATLAEPVHV